MAGNWSRWRIADVLWRSMGIVGSIRCGSAWSLKSDGSLITAADTANEAFLRKELVDDGEFFIGEESIAREGRGYVERALGEATWVVDPIDGTAPFAHGLPLWGISIGRMEGGVLKDGAVALPGMDMVLVTDGPSVVMAEGVSGPPSGWRWEELRPGPDEWNPGRLVTLGQDFTKGHLLPLPNPVLTPGSAVMALGWLIAGRAQAYVGHMKLWDIAGVLPMLARLGYRNITFGNREIVPDIFSGDVFDLDLGSAKCWRLRESFISGRPCAVSRLKEAIGLS